MSEATTISSKASARFSRVSAQKARLVANVVRGMDVSEAVETLGFLQKKSAPIIRKVIESAMANMEQSQPGVDDENVYVKTILVDQGPSLRRFRPRAQGRATRIEKKTSHISVELAVRSEE